MRFVCTDSHRIAFIHSGFTLTRNESQWFVTICEICVELHWPTLDWLWLAMIRDNSRGLHAFTKNYINSHWIDCDSRQFVSSDWIRGWSWTISRWYKVIRNACSIILWITIYWSFVKERPLLGHSPISENLFHENGNLLEMRSFN